MEQNNKQERGYPPNVIRICVDSCEYDLKGRVYTKIHTQAIQFDNCMDLFLKTDELFDKCGFPQTFQEKRKFFQQRRIGHYVVPKVLTDDKELRKQRGKLKTLDVFVQSRRRAGWQGFVLDEEGKRIFDFQGELELLKNIRELIQGQALYISKELFDENRLFIKEEVGK